MIDDVVLQKFCSSNGSKYDLHKIAIRDGYKYGCNGRIAVRIPTTEPDNEGNFPDYTDIFSRPVSKDVSFPEMETKGCETCYGDGRNRIACEDCDGGYDECPECHQEVPCRKCGGSGEWRGPGVCLVCNGSGKQFKETVIEGYPIDGSFLSKLINNLPDCRITGVPSGDDSGFKLSFTGGKAIVMPRKKPE